MGAVFLAEHSLIGRRAAIKVLRPERSVQRDNVERFFNEARATSAVADPGIVQVFDFGVTEDDAAYIVMEYLEGELLLNRLRRLHRLAPTDALRLVRQAAGSLAAAHAAGIVHRDLKPENLFVVRDSEAPGGERVKILDFGIAKLADEGERMQTRTGAVMGTPVYMSPEQCNDTSKTDHRGDIYSLGCVLYHLLTGAPPFDLHGFAAIAAAHLCEPALPPSARTPYLPPSIDALVLRCLAKAPGERFQTMGEVQQACDAVLAQLSVIGAPTFAVPGYAPPAPRTTLGMSAGQPSTLLTPRRLGRSIMLGAIAISVGAFTAIALSGRAPQASTPLASAPPPAAAMERPAAPPVTVEPIGPADAAVETFHDVVAPPPPPLRAAAALPVPAPHRAVRPASPPRAVPRDPDPQGLYDDRN